MSEAAGGKIISSLNTKGSVEILYRWFYFTLLHLHNIAKTTLSLWRHRVGLAKRLHAVFNDDPQSFKLC